MIFEDLINSVIIIFWLIVVVFLVIRAMKAAGEAAKKGPHPTLLNKSASYPKKGQVSMAPKKQTRSSDGHAIPRSKDITCEGQYGHIHGESGPRYIVHEEPTTGYCILNGKKVALKDCWKY